MAAKKCKPCAAAPVPIVAPAWADPTLSMITTAWRVSSVTPPMGSAVRVLKPDPTRVAVGFATGTAAGGSYAVGPTPNVSVSGFGSPSSVTWQWFHMFTFGPLINEAWYLVSTAPTAMYVYEIYRLQ